jgi:hypothetical protein
MLTLRRLQCKQKISAPTYRNGCQFRAGRVLKQARCMGLTKNKKNIKQGKMKKSEFRSTTVVGVLKDGKAAMGAMAK